MIDYYLLIYQLLEGDLIKDSNGDQSTFLAFIRKFSGVILTVISVILALLLLWVVLGIFKGIVVFAIAAIIIVAAVTFLLRNGKNMIMKERMIIDAQIAAKVPVKFSKSKVLLGYVQMFSFLWVLIPFIFLIPSSILWVYTLPPIIILFLILSSYWSNVWRELELGKGKYFLMHFLGILFPSLIVAAIKLIGSML